MCQRCDDLEEQVAYLKSELGLQERADAIEKIRRLMGSAATSNGRASVSRMILALYAAHGRPMNKYQIMDAVPSPTDKDRDAKIVDVWVCLARKRLGRDAVLNVWGNGYQLSPEAMERIALLLGDDQGRASILDIQELNDRESGELRSIAAHIAGILSHRDGDSGESVAKIYRRIADRVSLQPKAAA